MHDCNHSHKQQDWGFSTQNMAVKLFAVCVCVCCWVRPSMNRTQNEEGKERKECWRKKGKVCLCWTFLCCCVWQRRLNSRLKRMLLPSAFLLLKPRLLVCFVWRWPVLDNHCRFINLHSITISRLYLHCLNATDRFLEILWVKCDPDGSGTLPQ